MLQESAQKLRYGKVHGALLVAVGIVLRAESNRLAIKGEQSVIADGLGYFDTELEQFPMDPRRSR